MLSTKLELVVDADTARMLGFMCSNRRSPLRTMR